MSCRRRRPSRSPTPTSRPGRWRNPPVSTSGSRRSPRLRSCAPKHCCRRATCMHRLTTPIVPGRRTRGISRSSPSRSRRRWRRAPRLPRSASRRESRPSTAISSRKSCVPTVRRGASGRIARVMSPRAALELSKPIYEQFASLKLVQPFERSLQEKQRSMDAATKAFGALVDYQVGEVTAAATFYTAEIYANFGQALRESERPANLGVDALKDYEQQLADAAHPLEAKAIAVHEKNLELMRRGLN